MTHPTDALRLVPVEPTPEMLDAVKPWPKHWPSYEKAEASAQIAYNIDRAVIRSNWTHMLAAAPASPLPEGGGQCSGISGELSGWQDISTAPRQERVILGHKDFKGWFCLAICNALGEWSYDDRPWGQQDAPDKEATHWMPLPAAPTGAK